LILESEVTTYRNDKDIISEEDKGIIRQGHPIPLDSNAGPVSLSSE